ncbi:MAG TPA: type II toxin-antitoxin system RelE/ParE family toxin [Candidatus Acidoferrales bacterium]|nr:type II toxin-antitoxin system RelE/ParE family toxin [Candidatus Acidoferrales bacterium]
MARKSPGEMSRFRLTSKAVAYLSEIWSFIAQESPEAADRVEQAIYRACELLSESPLAGRFRKDLTSLPVRFWLVRPYHTYFIVYDSEPRPLLVIRILHVARDIPAILR